MPTDLLSTGVATSLQFVKNAVSAGVPLNMDEATGEGDRCHGKTRDTGLWENVFMHAGCYHE